MARKNQITASMKHDAELQIKDMQKQIDYDTKDYTIELLVDKFNKKDFFVPPYQRKFIWQPKNKSSFIESVLLGLPIPFMFFGDNEDGRMEIIDGAQRIQTLVSFKNDQLSLTNLKKLPSLNKFKFSDLSDSQQRKFLNRALRVVILEEGTTTDVKQDLFNRINTSGVKANDSEIRRGSYPGSFTTFIENCSNDEQFVKLCPVSEKQKNRHERFELVLRFFAYYDNYLNFVHDVNTFLDDYLINNLESIDELELGLVFKNTLLFIEKNFPNGFAKTKNAKSTPRVRFEAIAVGTALALKENPLLVVDNIDWIDSEEFKQLTTSDASNNQHKLKRRIEFVKNKLLGV